MCVVSDFMCLKAVANCYRFNIFYPNQQQTLTEPLVKIIRLYVKRKMTLNEYFRAKERLEKGGSLKWYEKKPFYYMQREEERIKPKLKELMTNWTNSLNESINKLDKYKK